MIKVRFLRDKNGNFLGYVVSGHAGFDEYGKDIVCSAVSVLSQTGLLSLKSILNINLNYKIDDGYLEVRIPKDITKEKLREVNIIINTILIGIKSTMEAYPKYITLEYGEV